VGILSSRLVYAVFFFSGATALVYQVLWARWLGLVFGNTTASAAVVLGAFMAGLALGSHVIGRRVAHIARPLLGYAIAEAGIGLFALAFPLTSSLVEKLFSLLISTDSAPAWGLLVRSVLSFALLLVPTALMGATLPLLTEHFRRNPRVSKTWRVGALYAANTFGAAIGTLVSSVVLIELLGVRATTFVAALLNLGIAVVAWRLTPAGGAASAGDAPPAAARTSSAGGLAIATLAATGALALACEVLWMRTLQTFLGSSTYAFSSIVFVYLVGIAVGGWLCARVVSRVGDNAVVALVALVAFMGAWMFVANGLFQSMVAAFDLERTQPTRLVAILAWYLLYDALLVPLALASGACFPLATRILNPHGSEAEGALVARAYSWNTWGAVAGSLLAGFVIAPRLDYLPAQALIGFLYVAVAAAGAVYALVAIGEPRARLVRVTAACVAIALFAVVGMRMQPSYEERLAVAKPHYEVVMHEPGVQAVTTVLRRRGEPLASTLFVNGQGMTTKLADTKLMAHLPLLLHPSPQNTLVICFGMGTTYRSAISHGGKVTAVELVGGVLDAFPHFYADADRVRAYPQGRMLVGDGRNFLMTTRERFDVITVDPPPPIDGAGVNNLYSRDFIELAASRLADGGIVAHWIPYGGTQSGVDDEQSFNMLVDTFTGVFPHVYSRPSINEVGLHIVGSFVPLHPSRDRIAARLAQPAVSADLNELQPVPLSFFLDVAYTPSRAPSGDLIVTDDRPLLEFYLLRTARNGGRKVLPMHLW
jgi:spermidine synthase